MSFLDRSSIFALFCLSCLSVVSFPVNAKADTISLSCSSRYNVVPNITSEQTTVCQDKSSKAPDGFAYFKADRYWEMTRQHGHHNAVQCNVRYHNPFETELMSPTGVAIPITAYRSVSVHGKAKADRMGQTAFVACAAEFKRVNLN